MSPQALPEKTGEATDGGMNIGQDTMILISIKISNREVMGTER